MFKVYKVNSKMHYNGYSLVGARSVEEANEYINDLKTFDNHSACNSFGYEFVTEKDELNCIYATSAGIILHGIEFNV